MYSPNIMIFSEYIHHLLVFLVKTTLKMIEREAKKQIENLIGKGKAIIVLGPRQVGKTTLIHDILKSRAHLFLNADDPTVRSILTNINTEELKDLIGKHKLVFIDEAQSIENIGLTLKLVTDQMKRVQLIVSGSSAFELGNALNESLTGRKRELRLFPISWKEWENEVGYLVAKQQLNIRLIYGFYPEVLSSPGEEKEALNELMNSYLFKDILALSGIKKPQVLEKLVRALAFQIGSEVSYNELAQLVGVDKNTVSNYIDLLEQAFVIYRLGSFSRNLRNEIKTNQKIYFYDNGLRNAIIGNFSSTEQRTDTGHLWENFLITERLKRTNYERRFSNHYFWRTVQQQKIDLIEEEEGEIKAFEFKWNPLAKFKVPKKFEEAYNTKVELIHKENFRAFVL